MHSESNTRYFMERY